MKTSRAAAMQAQAAQTIAERVSSIEAKVDTLICGTPAIDQVPTNERFDGGISHLEGRIGQVADQLAEIRATLEALATLVAELSRPAAPQASRK